MRVYQKKQGNTGSIGQKTCLPSRTPVASAAQSLTGVSIFRDAEVLPRHASTQTTHALLKLQQQHGNRYVQQILAAAGKHDDRAEIVPETKQAIQWARDGNQVSGKRMRAQMAPAFGAEAKLADHSPICATISLSMCQRSGIRETIPICSDRFLGRLEGIAKKPVIQRKKLDYRQLTWADFKKKPLQWSRYDARIFSHFHDPKISKLADRKALRALNAVQTKEQCKRRRRKKTKFKVNIKMDPQKIKIRPYMWQERSWAKLWITNNKARKKRCKATLVRRCKCAFDKMHRDIRRKRLKAVRKCRQIFAKRFKEVSRECRKWRRSCVRAFKTGDTRYKVTIGGKQAVAKSMRECKRVFFKKCKKLFMEGFSHTLTLDGKDVIAGTRAECATKFAKQYEKIARSSLKWTGSMAGETTQARSKADCSKGLLKECAGRMSQKASEVLLEHEQGHFNITNAMAQKTQTSLRDLIAAFDEEVTACGKRRAIAKAKRTLRKNVRQLKREYKAKVKEWRQTQKAYDRKTQHGQKLIEQAEWSQRITEGLLD